MDTRRKRIWLKLKLYVKNSGWDWILSSVVAGRRRPCLVTGDCTHALGGRGRIPTFQDPNRRSDPCIYNVKNALLACAIYLYVRIYHGGKKESKRKGKQHQMHHLSERRRESMGHAWLLSLHHPLLIPAAAVRQLSPLPPSKCPVHPPLGRQYHFQLGLYRNRQSLPEDE